MEDVKLFSGFKKNWTFIDYLNFVIYQFGEHKYCYDFEKLNTILKNRGYKNIFKDVFDPSEDIDLEIRKKYSMYLRAEK